MKNEFLPDGLWVVMDGSEKLVMKKKGFVLSSKCRGGHIDGYTFLRPAKNWSDTDMGDTMNVCKADGFYDVFNGDEYKGTLKYVVGQSMDHFEKYILRTDLPRAPKPELPDGLYLLNCTGFAFRLASKSGDSFYDFLSGELIHEDRCIVTARIPLEKI